ncbi:hypothetical protein AVEN_262243-1 [Araneus ventricosus]|uniref:Tc1-like transposase DDE domain-containing protein n=1 Tax=Araneus ventricosus TaxID=182803 RepID=A0A4Y2GGU5_ARAVE|nr:hypothetical protein AVEN_262243-1 [Araneus ventricosus]
MVGLWQTINAAVYFYTLQQPRSAILTSGVLLINCNAFSIQQLSEQYKLCMSDHPTYSPDLATSDFHLFPELKNWLGVKDSRKMRIFKAALRPIAHHRRQRSSKRE